MPAQSEIQRFEASVPKDECLRRLRLAGYDSIEAFCGFLTTYRGGMLVFEDGQSGSQIAHHSGVDRPVVDSLFAMRDFHLILREHITRAIVTPYEQAHLAKKLLGKTKETTDVRQMVAGMKHLDERAGLGPDSRDSGVRTLVVRYEQDKVTSPYEELEDVEDAEFTPLGGRDEQEEAHQPEAGEAEQSTARESAWTPRRTLETDLGDSRFASQGHEGEDGEAEKSRLAGLNPDGDPFEA